MTGSSVKLEWIILDEDEKLIEPRDSQPGPRRPRLRTLLKAGLALATLIVVTCLILYYRITQNQRQLKADFQTLVDLQAQVVANGDRELFLSLHGQENAAWVQWRGGIFDYYAQGTQEWPRLKVTRVKRAGDFSRVHITGTLKDTDEQFEWVLFYRLYRDGWRTIPPDVHYWGAVRERDVGQFHFVYHERDEPHVEAVAERLTELLDLVYTDLDQQTDTTLTVRLVIPDPFSVAMAINPTTLVFPSPSSGPHPILTLSPALMSHASQTLVPFLVFEAAGGEERWQDRVDGAWFVSASIQWIQERLWQRLYDGDVRSPFESIRELLRLFALNGPLPTLTQIWHDQHTWTNDYPDMIPFYASSKLKFRAHVLTIIDYIAEIYGPGAIPDLLSAIAQNDTLDGALRDALGASLEEFEPAWLAWFHAHYGDVQPEAGYCAPPNQVKSFHEMSGRARLPYCTRAGMRLWRSK